MKVTFVVKDLDDLTNVTPGNDMGMLPAARQANHQVGMSRFGPQVFVLQKNHMGQWRHEKPRQQFPIQKDSLDWAHLKLPVTSTWRPKSPFFNDGRNPSGTLKITFTSLTS